MSSTFAVMLCRLRRERGWSLRTLARRVPCSHVHLFQLERGTSRPTVAMATRLDRALGADGRLRAEVTGG